MRSLLAVSRLFSISSKVTFLGNVPTMPTTFNYAGTFVVHRRRRQNDKYSCVLCIKLNFIISILFIVTRCSIRRIWIVNINWCTSKTAETWPMTVDEQFSFIKIILMSKRSNWLQLTMAFVWIYISVSGVSTCKLKWGDVDIDMFQFIIFLFPTYFQTVAHSSSEISSLCFALNADAFSLTNLVCPVSNWSVACNRLLCYCHYYINRMDRNNDTMIHRLCILQFQFMCVHYSLSVLKHTPATNVANFSESLCAERAMWRQANA